MACVLCLYVTVFIICIPGGMCILWYMFWLLFVYEKPGHHPFITDEELEYIQEAQGKDTIDYEVNIRNNLRHFMFFIFHCQLLEQYDGVFMQVCLLASTICFNFCLQVNYRKAFDNYTSFKLEFGPV